jgi:hypothetical protein
LAPSVKGEAGTAVRAPEGLTEKMEMLSLLSFAAAKNAPLGLNATEVADGSGGELPTGVSAPEALTERISVPFASSPPLGLKAKPDPPFFES